MEQNLEQKQEKEVKKENLKEQECSVTFTKEQLLTSKRYKNQKDLLSAILKEQGSYTILEVEQKIEHYRKREVK